MRKASGELDLIYVGGVIVEIESLQEYAATVAGHTQLQKLRNLLQDLEDTANDIEHDEHLYPELLISETAFPHWCRKTVEDMMPDGLADIIKRNIDWDGVLFDMHKDYGKVVFDETIFYYRKA